MRASKWRSDAYPYWEWPSPHSRAALIALTSLKRRFASVGSIPCSVSLRASEDLTSKSVLGSPRQTNLVSIPREKLRKPISAHSSSGDWGLLAQALFQRG